MSSAQLSFARRSSKLLPAKALNLVAQQHTLSQLGSEEYKTISLRAEAAAKLISDFTHSDRIISGLGKRTVTLLMMKITTKYGRQNLIKLGCQLPPGKKRFWKLTKLVLSVEKCREGSLSKSAARMSTPNGVQKNVEI